MPRAPASLEKMVRVAKLNYQWDGNASLPVLVLSHALGADVSMWEAQIAELGGSFRILRFDTRGHGKSSAPPGPYVLQDLAADLVGLLDELGIAQVNFCGLSMGGMIGQIFALEYPQRLRRLVLANTGARIGTAESWNTRIETVQGEGLASVAGSVVERWLTPAYRAEYPAIFNRLRARMIATDPQGYVSCCAAIRDADLRQFLLQIGAPTLVLAGTYDPSTPPSDGQLLAQGIPGAKYVELPSAHLSNIECAAQFNQQILEFLE